MIRIGFCFLGFLLVLACERGHAQAQVNIPPAEMPAAPPPPPQISVPSISTSRPGEVNVPSPQTLPPKRPQAQVDSDIDADEQADTKSPIDLNPWLTQQAQSLLDVLGCYLKPPSLKNEVASETKNDSDPKRLIEVRIKLLKTLASHNAASHCK